MRPSPRFRPGPEPGSGKARSRRSSRPRSRARTCSGSRAETRSSTSSSSDPTGSCWPTRCPRAPPSARTTSVRDYYRAFFENDWPRDYVYVARSFRSVKDARYKIAVSTRIWGDRGELLGVLVANFTIGPRLIDVDMRQEPNDAAVLCPMDRSDPIRASDELARRWQFFPFSTGAVHGGLERRSFQGGRTRAGRVPERLDALTHHGCVERWSSSSITTVSARPPWLW